jgi:hypothetical protein
MENAKVVLIFGVMVGALWVSWVRPVSSAVSPGATASESSGPNAAVGQKWEYLRLVSNGHTARKQNGEWKHTYYLNGEEVKGMKVHEILNKLGRQGWELVTSNQGAYGASSQSAAVGANAYFDSDWFQGWSEVYVLRRPL